MIDVNHVGQKSLYSGGTTTITPGRGFEQFGGHACHFRQILTVKAGRKGYFGALAEEEMPLSNFRTEEEATAIRCALVSLVSIRRRKT